MDKKDDKPKVSVYDIVTERIIEYIEKNNVLPWTKPWATVDANQQNFKSKTIYNGINIFLTGMCGFASPYWLTFKQIIELGGKLKKDSRGTPIVYWQPSTKKADEDEEEDDKKLFRGFHRYYTVYNAEQIDGIEFPAIEPPKTREFTPIEEAEKVLRQMQNKPEIRHWGQSANYNPMLDRVTIPNTAFNSKEEYYSTVFHELAHSTGHPSRLNRFAIDNTSHKFGSKTYSKEELVAEMSSAFVLNTIGINTEQSDRNSSAYIKSWLRSLKNDPKMVVSASSRASRAADYIMIREV